MLASHQSMKMRLKMPPIRKIVAVIPVAVALVIPGVAQAFSFSNLYVFGDSLADSGNTYARSYGLIPPPPYFPGRASNGPVWVEYLAPQLGLTYNPANNFAFAGATSGNTNTLPFATLFGLQGLRQEVSTYTSLIPPRGADPNALYIVQAGANDYLGGGLPNPRTVVNNVTSAIEILVSAGAKNFLVSNLPDLGSLPGARNSITSVGLTLLSDIHNSLLSQSLVALSQTLGSGVNLVQLDLNGLFDVVTANPATFGLTNVTDACISSTPSLSTIGTTPTVCGNPNSYLFWDNIHPTTSAHQTIASFANYTLALNYPPPRVGALSISALSDASAAAAVPEPPATAGLVIFGVFLGTVSVVKRRQQRRNLPANVGRSALPGKS